MCRGLQRQESGRQGTSISEKGIIIAVEREIPEETLVMPWKRLGINLFTVRGLRNTNTGRKGEIRRGKETTASVKVTAFF